MYVVRGHMRVIPLQTTAITLPSVGCTSNYARLRLPNNSHLRHVQAAHRTITLQRSSPLHSHAADCIRTFILHTSTYYYPHKPSIPICACFYTPTTYTSHLSPVKQYVYELNNIILPNLQCDPVTYKSVDTVVRADGVVNYPTYFKHARPLREQDRE
jgi:hypothetical protein